MKRFVLSVFSLVFLLIIAALVIPFFVPAETYKRQVLSLIHEKTGRTITVDGDITFHLLPNPSLSLQKVTISNPAGFEHKYMAEIESLSLQVALMPLFDREVHVLGLELNKPVIYLEKNNGGGNWEFKESLAGKEETVKADESPAPGQQTFRMETLEIINGEITYLDHTAHTTHTLKDVKASLTTVDKTKLTLTARYKDAPIALTASTGALESLQKGSEELLSVDFDGPGVDAQYQGQFSTAPMMNGDLSLSIDSVNALQKALGEKPSVPENVQDNFSMQGDMAWKSQRLSLRDAELKFDGILAQGNVDADLSGTTPSISATLRTKEVDLTPFAGKDSSAPAQQAGQSSAKSWSDEKVDLAGLKTVNLAADLSIEVLKYKKLLLQNVQGKLHIHNGMLSADFPAISLYEGTAVLRVKADADSATLGSSLILKGVNTEQLLSNAADFDKLTGKLNAEFNLSTHGSSERQWVQALDGSGSFAIANGAVKGVNLASMVRNIKSAFLAGKTFEQTDFAELSGSLKATNGLVRNDDLSLKAPLLRLSGAGEVNLPARTINYRIEPKVVKSLEGQGALEAEEAKGLVVPVMVTGTLDNPHFAPDLRSVIEEGIKNPENVKQTIKGLKGGVKEEIKGLEQEFKGIRDIFRKPKAEPAPASPASPPVPEPVAAPVETKPSPQGN